MVRAKKSLGQNFLVDPNIQRRIVAALDPGPGDVVVEIGPGTGALTRHIAGRTQRLVAIEKDDTLAEALASEFRDVPSVRIVRGDALEIDPHTVVGDVSGPDANFKIIGNIPYNITTPLIFHLLAMRPPPERIVLMIQKEVADRILAEPGDRAYGALSVGVRLAARVERLFNVGRRAFRPAPDVDSTVLLLTPFRPPPLDAEMEQDVRTLTRTAFGWRRKQLQHTLRNAPEYGLDPPAAARLLEQVGARPDARPETLAPPDFVRLARALRLLGLPAHGDPTDSSAPRAADALATPAPVPMDDEQARRRLVGLISHELRSPIAAILGYQELLAEGIFGEISPRGTEALSRIGGAARQLRHLIDGIELLLGEPPAQPAATSTVHPAATLREVLASASAEADLRGTSIVADVDDLPALRTDPDSFARALFHALGATLKAAPGKPLRVSAAAHEDRLTIRIAGAALHDHQPLDEHSLPATGPGLRLAIARRTLRAIGGELRLLGDDAAEPGLELTVRYGSVD